MCVCLCIKGVCVCGPTMEVLAAWWGFELWRPPREPSLAGLMSVSHLLQVALEELRVSPFHFHKGGKRRRKASSYKITSTWKDLMWSKLSRCIRQWAWREAVGLWRGFSSMFQITIEVLQNWAGRCWGALLFWTGRGGASLRWGVFKKKNPFSERLEISAATSDQLTTEGLLPDPFGNIWRLDECLKA